MSDSRDPERYSIDDMMDRLKTNPSDSDQEEKKLVIRADGSKAVRVKRRKRRTNQDKDKSRLRRQKIRMIQIAAVCGLVMLVLVAVGFLTVYVNGAAFREEVKVKIEETSGANVEMAQFRMNPTSANAGSLKLDWPNGNMLKSLTLGGLSAKVSPISIVGDVLDGQEVSADRGSLALRLPEAGGEMRFSELIDGEPTIRFGEYTIRDFRFHVEDAGGRKLIDVLESEAAFIPPNIANKPQLLLARGKVSINGWPRFVLDRAHIEFFDGKAEFVGLRLRNDVDSSGVLELQGIFDPYANKPSTLEVSTESFPLLGLIGDEFGNFFSGRIDVGLDSPAGVLAIQCGEVPSVALSMPFRNALASPMQVSDFPFLFGLSQTLGDEWFSQPAFLDGVSGKIRRVNRQVIMEDLDLSFKGRMAIKGVVVLDESKQLSGKLRVGVTNGMIKAANNKVLDRMFGGMDDGFRWMDVDISGSASAPKDNFRQIYEAVLSSEQSEPESSKVPTFDQLTQPR